MHNIITQHSLHRYTTLHALHRYAIRECITSLRNMRYTLLRALHRCAMRYTSLRDGLQMLHHYAILSCITYYTFVIRVTSLRDTHTITSLRHIQLHRYNARAIDSTSLRVGYYNIFDCSNPVDRDIRVYQRYHACIVSSVH